MKKEAGRITIHDIAAQLGLHASTVSRALSDNPAVSKRTRSLIKEKARELNYRPNQMAAALRRGRSDMLGVVVPAIDRSFFASVIRGVEEEANVAGLHVMVCQTYDDAERERKLVEGLQAMRVDGIIISTAKDVSSDAEFFRSVIAAGTPIQFFDSTPIGLDASAVVINDRGGAYLATKHLLDQGLERVAHLRGPQHLHIYRDRLEGYKDALKEAGIPFDEALMVDITSHFDNGHKAFVHLWSRKIKPNGIFSSSDYAAAGIMQAAQASGLRVPDDLAVIGFANEPFTELMTPALSTVDQQTLSMGRKAARRLIAVVNDETPDVHRVVLEPSVIVRASSRIR